MKTRYWLQVFFLSLEFLVIILAVLIHIAFTSELNSFARQATINKDALQYLALVPVGLAVWLANELRLLVHEDRNAAKLLIDWSEYWTLKVHIWVSLMYAAIFTATSLLPWIIVGGVSTGLGLLLLTSSIVGQLILAASVYGARFRVKEIFINTRES